MHCVYFVRSGAHLKIGRTKNIENRVDKLKTLAPKGVEILLTIPCDGHQQSVYFENVLHNMFAPYRINGEWFRYKSDLRRFVTTCATGDKHHAVALVASWIGKKAKEVSKAVS